MMFRSSGLGSDLTSFTDPFGNPVSLAPAERPAITMFTDPIPGVSVALPAPTPIDPRPASGPGSLPAVAAVMPARVCRAWEALATSGACEVSAASVLAAPAELIGFSGSGSSLFNNAVWVGLAFLAYRSMSGGRR